MKKFDVQAVEIHAPAQSVFEFVRRPANLPKWAHAFQSADDRRARLATPQGTVDIELRTTALSSSHSVDWELVFPDGSIGLAQSRVTPTQRGTSIYSFVLHAPPVPLEQLEGAMSEQIETLRKELAELKRLMESR